MSESNGNGKKNGRPKKEVDLDMVYALAAVGCSGEEIAIHVGCSRSTLYARFSDTLQKGHTEQKVSLRRKQHEVAMKGNVGMLVWLGKQLLGQTDKQEISGPEDAYARDPLDFRKKTMATLNIGNTNRMGNGNGNGN